jgi:hypothetical protein
MRYEDDDLNGEKRGRGVRMGRLIHSNIKAMDGEAMIVPNHDCDLARGGLCCRCARWTARGNTAQ